MISPTDTLDRSFMAEALALAAGIARRPWPNPPVGALVVANGHVVGRGAHCGPGTRHAEIVALEEAGPLARGATLYCTLEPCNHDGHTPPCAPVVAASGIRRLVTGVLDPNTRVAGGGLAVVRDAGIAITSGVLADRALDLIWPFAATDAFSRPFVLLKTAVSLDGFFAPAEAAESPGPRYLTGAAARREVHRLRRWADLVVVGERTMAADRPRLDARLASEVGDGPAADPLPAYVDTNLSLAGATPERAHIVFAGPEAPAKAAARIRQNGGRVVPCETRDGHVAPESLLEACRQGGWHTLLVEGGPTLAASFLASGLVDCWVAFTAPVVLGAGVQWPMVAPPQRRASPFSLTRIEQVGADVMAVYDRESFPAALSALAGAEGRS